MPTPGAPPLEASPGLHRRRIRVGRSVRTVLEAGRGGRPVLFLHGFPDNVETWADVLAALGPLGFHGHAVSMPGYAEETELHSGPSAGPRPAYRPADVAREILAVLDALDLRRVALVGHDWGAVTAYACAALAPDRIEKLVVLGLPPIPVLARNLARHPARLLDLRHLGFFQIPYLAGRWLRRDDFRNIELLWRRWSPTHAVVPEHLASVKATFRAAGTADAALAYYRDSGLGACLAPRQWADSMRLLWRRVAVPLLLLAGDDDGGIGPELFSGASEWCAAQLAFHVVRGAGHFMQQEQPETVAALVAQFLESP